MRRRELMFPLGGMMTAARALRAQQKAMPMIGFLSSRAPGESSASVAGFRQGLSETGYVEGQNAGIKYRWAEGQYDRRSALAAELVGEKIDVIVAAGGIPAARAKGVQLHILTASTESDVDAAFASLVQLHAGALLLGSDPFFLSRRDQVVALASRHAVPAIYEQPEYAASGGLISYGSSLAAAYRQAGIYAGRILKGERPADLPVQQPATFELVVNLKTVKALGITVPQIILAGADEVIE